MPFPHQCLAFVGVEFPLSVTCLGRGLSHILQSNLDAWCAHCVWPWCSHFAPRVATRTASQARIEWSPRVGAPPRSCRASSVTRTPRCQWVFPKLPCTLAAKLQAQLMDVLWHSSGLVPHLGLPLVQPHARHPGQRLSEQLVHRHHSLWRHKSSRQTTHLSSLEKLTGHDGGLSNANQCLFPTETGSNVLSQTGCALRSYHTSRCLRSLRYGHPGTVGYLFKAHSFAILWERRAVAVFHDDM